MGKGVHPRPVSYPKPLGRVRNGLDTREKFALRHGDEGKAAPDLYHLQQMEMTSLAYHLINAHPRRVRLELLTTIIREYYMERETVARRPAGVSLDGLALALGIDLAVVKQLRNFYSYRAEQARRVRVHGGTKFNKANKIRWVVDTEQGVKIVLR